MAVEFRFNGGPNDGKAMRDDVYRDGEHLFVEKWWVATSEGQLGSKFNIYSDKNSAEIAKKGVEAEFYRHWYEVTERKNEAEDVIVTCQYRHAEHAA